MLAFSGTFSGDGMTDLVGVPPSGMRQFSTLKLVGYSSAAAELSVAGYPASDQIVAIYNGDDIFTSSTSSRLQVAHSGIG